MRMRMRNGGSAHVKDNKYAFARPLVVTKGAVAPVTTAN